MVSSILCRDHLTQEETLTNKLDIKPNPPTAIGKIKDLLIAKVYACKTPGSAAPATCRTCVAPAPIIVAGLIPGANFGISSISVFVNIFCATLIDMAPPRELKKMAIASMFC